MAKRVIDAVGISKRYRLGEGRVRYRTLRETLSGAVRGAWRRETPAHDFWALREVDLQVEQGEVVAIIGRNGAGKSTLLKILSRITEPTRGYADITGRVGALLEVGTGFHHELTGRENIFLNGSILGMKRHEILRQFEAIVDFAEVEQFIDTPVKRYSSGMYLRLAFAVAAHLEPEILLIDEVLAVGDAAFQKKCLGKMDDVARQGRTVLFVSHNLGAVQELCQRAILLDGGEVVHRGTPAESISEYLRRLEEAPAPTVGNSPLVIGRPRIVAGETGVEGAISASRPFRLILPIEARQLHNPWIYLMIEDFAGRQIIHQRIASRELGAEVLDGAVTIRLDLPPLWLTPGVYAGQFKFLVAHSMGGSGRLLSDKFMIEVRGDFDPAGRAVLNPKIDWGIGGDNHSEIGASTRSSS
ncbi:MAG: ABC transporter ATP-binding protein [Acidobacteriota bacterium]